MKNKSFFWIFIIVLNSQFSILNSPLLKAQNPHWMEFNTSNSELPDNGVFVITIDSNGTKWLGVGVVQETRNTADLVKFDNHNWTHYNMNQIPVLDYEISSIAIVNYGRKWLATGGGGVIVFNDNGWMIYNSKNSGLPYDIINDLVIDSNNNKWIAYDVIGLVKYDGKNWITYNTSNSPLPSNYIGILQLEDEKILWILCGPLVKFDGTNWFIYNSTNSCLSPGSVSSISIDKQGNKWLSTTTYISNYGLTKFDGNNCTIYNTSNSGILSNGIGEIAIDKDGNIWFLDGIGLVKFDGSNWTIYNNTNSELPLYNFTRFAIDKQGNKWIGTQDNGLIVFNENGISIGSIISGTVSYNNDKNTLLSNVIVNLKNKEGNIIARDTTGIDGVYKFINIFDDDYTLEISINKDWGGGNSGDALLINKNYIGAYTFTDSLKLRAADVNLDNDIDPGDALFINRRYIGVIANFNLPDWLFCNASITVNEKDVVYNIKAICAGDVDGSYIPK